MLRYVVVFPLSLSKVLTFKYNISLELVKGNVGNFSFFVLLDIKRRKTTCLNVEDLEESSLTNMTSLLLIWVSVG